MASGMPCWFELATNDQNGAKAFYTGLFGWTVVDHEMGPGAVYTVLQLDGKDVGAAYTMGPEMAGIPPYWAVYFAAADVDAAAPRVEELGGKVVMQPFDVGTHGRMLVATDPAGASFCLWQAKEHIGAQVMGVPHAVTWVELATHDLGAAMAFYGPLLGWTSRAHESGHTGYQVVASAGKDWGGLLQMDASWGPVPPHWSVYYMVGDVDAIAAKAVELGGKICVPAFDAPGVGRIARINDPQGAGFYIIKLLGAA